MINIQNTILGKIVDRKHEELAARLKQRNLQDVEELAKAASPVRGFANALQHKRPGVIAEIKKHLHQKESFAQTLILLKLLSNMNTLEQHVYRY